MPELDFASITLETFLPVVGQTFEAVFPDGRLPMTLLEARPVGTGDPNAPREPFALVFKGPPGYQLPQYSYRLEHPELGEMLMFLVPIGTNGDSINLEAVFA